MTSEARKDTAGGTANPMWDACRLVSERFQRACAVPVPTPGAAVVRYDVAASPDFLRADGTRARTLTVVAEIAEVPPPCATT
jgi:hypothetical protein